MNTQFNFTLKTDDDCLVDMEAIMRVMVLCFNYYIQPERASFTTFPNTGRRAENTTKSKVV